MPAGDEKEGGYGALWVCVFSRSFPRISFLFFFGTNEVSEARVYTRTDRAPVLVVFILTRMHAYVYMHLKYSTVGP